MARTPCKYGGPWEKYPSCLPIALYLQCDVCNIGRGCGLNLIDTPTHSDTSDW